MFQSAASWAYCVLEQWVWEVCVCVCVCVCACVCVCVVGACITTSEMKVKKINSQT